MHEVTRIALRHLIFENRPVEFISAFSVDEARNCLAIILILLLYYWILSWKRRTLDWPWFDYVRYELANDIVRIILRTGHPGQAPEEKVIFEYDINDYREKTELTTQRLLTAVVTALRSYRDLITINDNRRALKQVIDSSSRIFRLQSIKNYATGILTHLSELSCLHPRAECHRSVWVHRREKTIW